MWDNRVEAVDVHREEKLGGVRRENERIEVAVNMVNVVDIEGE